MPALYSRRVGRTHPRRRAPHTGDPHQELQQKDPPLIGGTTKSKFVDWFLILENEFISRELEDSDQRIRWAANGLKNEISLYATVSECKGLNKWFAHKYAGN
jgi:hypothetical protein